MGNWQNKIVGHDNIAPDQLLAHPENWRVHPQYQQKALRGVINDIGFIKSVTVNRRTGRVVDGHLRVTLALRDGIPTIPVEYVDLTEEEEAEALLTIDPIAALAGSDKDNLETLLQQVNTDDADVMSLLNRISGKVETLNEADAFGNLPDQDRAPFQQMTFTLHDEQAEKVREALKLSKTMGAFTDSPNENSNGNALSRICETFITEHGNG